MRLVDAPAKDRMYRLADGDGLYLAVAPSGVKSWQFRYILPGAPGERPRETIATLGRFPETPLGVARTLAEEARATVAEGKNVAVANHVKKVAKAAAHYATFGTLADAWRADEARRKRWSADYCREVENSIANHLKTIAPLPVNELSAAICAPIVRKLERRAPDMAAKVTQRLHAILDFAVEHGQIERNPLPAVRRARIERAHYPAVVTREGVGTILRASDALDVGKGVRRAHALLVFTCQRVGEIVPAQWSEFDLDAGTWAIPRQRMKMKKGARGDHLVPLPPRLLADLETWRRADGDGAVFVCASPGSTSDNPKAITREAMEKHYRDRLGLAGKHSPHSWRSVFSTWARDAGRDGEAIEAQLDHLTGSAVQAAYDRATRLDLRRELMAWHEATLLAARDGAKVIELRRESNP